MFKRVCQQLSLPAGRARLALLACLLAAPAVYTSDAAELRSIAGARLIETEWADGDSFRVEFPDGARHTVRLYGADCIELHIGSGDTTDARRLRAQRRYFGISNFGGGYAESTAKALELAAAARDAVRELLAVPFTVHTAFADGGGDGRYKRVYGFVETADGDDLATVLVERGLARAFGVYRSTPGGLSRDDYMEQLKDAELVAARRGRGAWKFTDWDNLRNERIAQRLDERELELAMGSAEPTSPLDLNSAARDELMRIPGIGEVTANRIIEARPFKSVDDLDRVYGIGPSTIERIRPFLKLEADDDADQGQP